MIAPSSYTNLNPQPEGNIDSSRMISSFWYVNKKDSDEDIIIIIVRFFGLRLVFTLVMLLLRWLCWYYVGYVGITLIVLVLCWLCWYYIGCVGITLVTLVLR